MFRDRKYAAHLLAEKLAEYKGKDAIIVAIPRGGVVIGYHLAVALGLPLDIIPSKRIKDPTDPHRSIGSVTLNGVDLLPNILQIPQDYIYHQVTMTQHLLKHEYEKYVGAQQPKNLTDKTLLLIDDRISSTSQFLACYRSLANRNPRKIIAVTPVLTNDALQRLKEENCDVIYLDATRHVNLEEYYEFLPKVTEEEIIQLMHNARSIK
jgi:predicted phosphoribosyltransferase